LANARGDIAHAIELSEHPQVLPHREAMRHVDIGTLEVHPPERPVTVARHVDAEHMNRAGARQHQPHDHADRRRLARAVAAEQAGHRAGRNVEGNRIDRRHVAKPLGQLARRNRGRRRRIVFVLRGQWVAKLQQSNWRAASPRRRPSFRCPAPRYQ
jgi:hypothetical protein